MASAPARLGVDPEPDTTIPASKLPTQETLFRLPSATRTDPLGLRHRMSLPGPWARQLAKLDHAFQPIVNTQSGIAFGYEALLRNTDREGFASIEEFFDKCNAEGVLIDMELALCDRAMAKFRTIPGNDKYKLFMNFDNRTLAAGESVAARIHRIARRHGVSEDLVVIEISERHPLGNSGEVDAILRGFRKYGFNLAIDDFGAGFWGLQMLYAIDADMIKFDRFFIHGIANDSKKRLLLSQIISIAHLLGIQIVAEGVQSEQDYLTCRDVGCEIVQGYIVDRPTGDVGELKQQYAHVADLTMKWKRRKASDEWIVREQIEPLEPISIDTSMTKLFERFRHNKSATFFPVIDRVGVPIGIIREIALKEYTYSNYGRALIENKSIGLQLHHFVTKCPVADINLDAQKILENYAADKVTEGIVVVEDMRYIGFLSADALLRVLNEKRIATAQDQNPLTKLPGNISIHDFVARAMDDVGSPYTLCYFDFDNFKPFNDKYGFRVGDRALLLFAEMMRKSLSYNGSFIGHVGGDDFFFGLRERQDFGATLAIVRSLIGRFAQEAAVFYDEDARAQGYIEASDRMGVMRRYALLGVSAVLIILPAARRVYTVDEVSRRIAALKNEAKSAADRIASETL